MPVSRHTPPAQHWRLLGHLARVDRHDHADHQLVYPSSGILTVLTDAGTWVVPPHRAVWLPAGQPHAHQAHGVTHMRSVLFPPHTNPLRLTRPTVLPVSALLREVLLALTAVPAPAEPRRTHLRQLVLDELAVLDAPERDRVPALHLPEPSDDRLRAVTALLADDPSDGRTLAELGRVVGAGERTLSRLFHAELGMGFPQWRGRLRMLHALIELTDGRSITAVANRHGYGNPSAFVAAFRRVFGTTPGAYRATLTGTPPSE